MFIPSAVCVNEFIIDVMSCVSLSIPVALAIDVADVDVDVDDDGRC